MQHCKFLICNLLVISYIQQRAHHLASTTGVEQTRAIFTKWSTKRQRSTCIKNLQQLVNHTFRQYLTSSSGAPEAPAPHHSSGWQLLHQSALLVAAKG